MMTFILMLDEDDPGDTLLANLFDKYYKLWINCVNRLFEDHAGISAEDIVSDVLISMIRHKDTLVKMTENQCVGYIGKSLLNRCKEVWRKKEVPVVPIDEAYQLEHRDTDVYAAYEIIAMKYRCLQILYELPERDRDILFADYYGYTKAEMQQAFNLKADSMRSQLSRSHKKLRERVREVFKDEFEINA